MLAFLTNWKTLLAFLLSGSAVALRFIPFTAPIVAAILQTRIGRTVALIVLAIVLLLLGASFYESRGYQRGVDDTNQRIEEQNARAKRAADAAAMNVEQCYDAGNDWDQAAGKCRVKP